MSVSRGSLSAHCDLASFDLSQITNPFDPSSIKMIDLPSFRRPTLLISRDLFFTSRVTGTAKELGLHVEVVPDIAAALSRLRDGPVGCLFCDLADPGLNVAELLDALPRKPRP